MNIDELFYKPHIEPTREYRSEGVILHEEPVNTSVPEEDRVCWFGNGVTVTGVFAVRDALNKNGYEHIEIMLTSGFGNPEKVRAFVRAEKLIGVRLFDSLGVGGIFDSREATMDVVSVGVSVDSFEPVSKQGRGYRKNPRLSRVL